MLKLMNVNKKFKKLHAVKDVTFSIAPGQIVGILGPNGAGKSTTIKMIAGLLRTTSGEISVNNHQVKTIAAKKSFAYIPEFPELYEMMTVDEHMKFIAQAYKVDQWEEKIIPYLSRYDLLDKRKTLTKELSKGMKQKVSICCGILTDAPLLLFDEPMIGLDPKAIRETKKIMAELKADNKSLLVSTHLLDSIEDVCDRVLVLKEGEVILDRSVEDLRQESDASLEEIFLAVTEDV